MNLTTLTLPLVLTGQVDRIEDNWAVIDWRGASTGELPTSLLETPLAEGDTVVLRVGNRSMGRLRNTTTVQASALSGTPAVLATTAGLIEIPCSTPLRVGRTYHLSLVTRADPSVRVPFPQPLRLPLAGPGAPP